MAEQSTPAEDQASDYAEHLATYDGFITGSIAVCLTAAFVMVALVMFGFGKTASVFVGFLGIVLGMGAIAVDIMNGRGRWLFSIIALLVFAFVTALNIS